MLVEGSFLLAVPCGFCGKMEIQRISLFQLAKGKKEKFTCSCGKAQIYIKTQDYKTFEFNIPCSICGEDHIFYYTLHQLFTGKGYMGKCSLTGSDILVIGNKDWIESYTKKANAQMDQIMEELGFDNYFYNPDIMMDALDGVHKIAEEGNLYCDCGSKEIDMSLFPDRIELKCLKCNSISVIYAENREDLTYLENTHSIILHEKTFVCIDAIYYNGNRQN